MRSALIIIGIVVFSMACKSTQNLSSDGVIISMQKTRCFGSCPVYTIEISGNGFLTYRGVENVDMLGEFKAIMDRSTFDTLVEEFRNSNFFEFEESYTSTASDLPTTYISFTDGGKSLKITDYDGAPAELKRLEGLVEELVPKLKWEKTTDL